MCERERFCKKVPLETKQLILLEFNGASKVVPVVPENRTMQMIYQKLVGTVGDLNLKLCMLKLNP